MSGLAPMTSSKGASLLSCMRVHLDWIASRAASRLVASQCFLAAVRIKAGGWRVRSQSLSWPLSRIRRGSGQLMPRALNPSSKARPGPLAIPAALAPVRMLCTL